MKKVNDQYKQDQDGTYHHTEWEIEGHTVEVNSDEYGHHVRIDHDGMSTVPNLDDKSFSAFIINLVRRWRGIK